MILIDGVRCAQVIFQIAPGHSSLIVLPRNSKKEKAKANRFLNDFGLLGQYHNIYLYIVRTHNEFFQPRNHKNVIK